MILNIIQNLPMHKKSKEILGVIVKTILEIKLEVTSLVFTDNAFIQYLSYTLLWQHYYRSCHSILQY